MADVFDAINVWLLEEALGDHGLTQIIEGLAERLKDGGLPITRINTGRTILHPLFGLIDCEWHSDRPTTRTNMVARDQINRDMFVGTPFGEMSDGKDGTNGVLVADLTDPKERAKYGIFERLAKDGMTGYAAFVSQFGTEQLLFENFTEGFRGANISFATRRFSGFSQADIDGLARIVPAFMVCARIDNERMVAAGVVDTYLGPITGQRVLTGQIARGDAQSIECVLLMSDMRGSVSISQSQDMKGYVDTLNGYFDCTAKAVMEHGGEVLKFIGDGVLAIFPIDDQLRSRPAMCAAALSSAREAFARAIHLNTQRAAADLPHIDFGIALHVGQVIYGNVGVPKRLDFTATGAAVGLVSRCEALTRSLDSPLLATQDFAQHCTDVATPLGHHELRGFEDGIELVAYSTTPD
ncbi:MAG: adenylate/guanylate cyclase domain-containing protein [Sedimentitalea sp.]